MKVSEPFVLVTAAYNEGKYLEGTIVSIVSQDLLPAKWVIVSDGSTDDTDSIALRYAARHKFIHLLRLMEEHPRNFAAQANAINAGIAQLRNETYSFIGNLDADITLNSSYFRLLLGKFRQNPGLGLAGGAINDKVEDGAFRYRGGNNINSVAHAVQLFRRECFEAVGGSYRPLPYGGPDTYAEITARMKGWQVASFPDLPVFHHRPTSSADHFLHGQFRMGKMDFSLGVSPLFEVLKVLRRMGIRPSYATGCLARFAGYVYSGLRREQRAVPEQFVSYLRWEENQRVRALFKIR